MIERDKRDETKETLLQQCDRHFPGHSFQLLPEDGEPGFAIADVGPFRIELRLQRGDITAECSVGWKIPGIAWKAHQTMVCTERYPDDPLTDAEALAQAAAQWRQLTAEAMAVVGTEKPKDIAAKVEALPAFLKEDISRDENFVFRWVADFTWDDENYGSPGQHADELRHEANEYFNEQGLELKNIRSDCDTVYGVLVDKESEIA